MLLGRDILYPALHNHRCLELAYDDIIVQQRDLRTVWGALPALSYSEVVDVESKKGDTQYRGHHDTRKRAGGEALM